MPGGGGGSGSSLLRDGIRGGRSPLGESPRGARDMGELEREPRGEGAADDEGPPLPAPREGDGDLALGPRPAWAGGDWAAAEGSAATPGSRSRDAEFGFCGGDPPESGGLASVAEEVSGTWTDSGAAPLLLLSRDSRRTLPEEAKGEAEG